MTCAHDVIATHPRSPLRSGREEKLKRLSSLAAVKFFICNYLGYQGHFFVDVRPHRGAVRGVELRAAVAEKIGVAPREIKLEQWRGLTATGEQAVMTNEKDRSGPSFFSTADGQRLRYTQVRDQKDFGLGDSDIPIVFPGCTPCIDAFKR